MPKRKYGKTAKALFNMLSSRPITDREQMQENREKEASKSREKGGNVDEEDTNDKAESCPLPQSTGDDIKQEDTEGWIMKLHVTHDPYDSPGSTSEFDSESDKYFELVTHDKEYAKLVKKRERAEQIQQYMKDQYGKNWLDHTVNKESLLETLSCV